MKKFIITIVAGYLIIAAVIFFLPKMKQDTTSLPKSFQDENLKRTTHKKGIWMTKAPPPSEALRKVEMRRTKVPTTFRTYYGNGALSSEWQSDQQREQQETAKGNFKAYYQDGNIWLDINLRNGRPDGVFRVFYPNGFLWEEGSYSEGQLNGDLRYYYPTGSIWVDSVYQSGLLVSVSKLCSETGEQLKVEIDGAAPRSGSDATILSGQSNSATSTLKTYYDNKTMSSEWSLAGRVLQGVVAFYYPSGEVLNEVTYRASKPVKSFVAYYLNKRVWYEVTYEAGLRSMTAVYYPSGKPWFSLNHGGQERDLIPRAFSEKEASDQRFSSDQVS